MKNTAVLLNPGANSLPCTFPCGRDQVGIWFDGDPRFLLPTKEEDGTLHLPLRQTGMTFVTMRDKTQFVVRYGTDDMRDPLTGLCMFMGEDEGKPFMTRVSSGVFHVLVGAGEEAFYEALKPSGIKYLEDLYGVKGRMERQGDIFLHPVGLSWFDISGGSHTVSSGGNAFEIQRIQSDPVFPGIRHFLTGTRLPKGVEIAVGGRLMPSETAVVEGDLIAPDHRLKSVGKGPYALMRSAHILPAPSIEAARRMVLRWD